MKSALNISLIQSDIVWENPDKNIDKLNKLLEDIPQGTDLVVLPETFATGFCIRNPELAKKSGPIILNWMREKSIELNVGLIGSMLTENDGQLTNRCYCISEEGKATFYDKRHLFRYGKEDRYVSSGTERMIWDFKGWKIMPLICYDLRFPVWSRNDLNYDLLIYVANWPEVRNHAWKTLLKARAIENMSYTIGCNRVGRDKWDIPHSGDSIVLDPMGLDMAVGEAFKDEVINSTLEKKHLENLRQRFRFLNDRDAFHIEI